MLTVAIVTIFLFTLFFVLHKQTNECEIKNLSSLIKLPDFARSTSFLEHRIQSYEDASNRLYPKMQYTKQMDFVYAK